jgi:hypothetical protein
MKTHHTIANAATIIGLAFTFSTGAVAQSASGQLLSPAQSAKAARQAAQYERVMPADAAPIEDGAALVLNFKPLYRSIFATLTPEHARYVDFLGRQVIDGVPLLIEGNVVLYGRMLAERAHGAARINPHVIRGVQVGRAFDELHLVHVAMWEDFDRRPIAIIKLHYRDGTTADLPVVFGAHLRGGLRMPTEENETLADPDSKIIWRGPGPGTTQFHGLDRLFKSMLRNPSPGKIVDTLDLESAGEPLAGYNLVAATVTASDPKRPVTPGLPIEPSRNFDGRLLVRVLDQSTHLPVANTMILPRFNLDGMRLDGSMLLTSPEGEATVRYPVASTTDISIQASKDGLFVNSAPWQPGTTSITLELATLTR